MKLPCHVRIVSNLSGSAISPNVISSVKNVTIFSGEGSQKIEFDVESDTDQALIGL